MDVTDGGETSRGAPRDDSPVAPPTLPRSGTAPLRRPAPLVGVSLTGFAMGVAEVVPGFSGGTVALVAGIYERLVVAVRTAVHGLALLLRGRVRPAAAALLSVDWVFVIVLGTGMLLALFTAARPLQRLIEDYPAEVSATFLGLVLGAALVAVRHLHHPSARHAVLVVVTAVAAFAVLGLRPEGFDDPGLGVIFAAAAVAVCAWILPGVSGSFLLLVLGVYPAVVGALSERDLVVVGVVAAGCVVGLAAFSTALSWLLARAHDVVIAVLIGVMAGSVRVLWPWPSDAGLGSAELAAPPGVEALLAAALALAAFATVWILGLAAGAVERFAARRSAARQDP